MFVDFSQSRAMLAAQQQPKKPSDTSGEAQNASIQPTTLALNEEGGTKPPIDATTLALNEEGGTKPPFTSYVVGEEGGGIPPYPIPDPLPNQSIATRDAKKVLSEADKGTNGAAGDGKLTRQELSSYVSYLQGIRFIADPGPEYTNKLNAAQFMLNHFDALARSGGYFDDPTTVSSQDIQQAAPRDGNAADLSTRDLNGQTVSRAWWENGGGSWPPMPIPYPPQPYPEPPMPIPLPPVSNVWLEGGYQPGLL